MSTHSTTTTAAILTSLCSPKALLHGALLVALLTMTSAAQAGTFTWNGSASGLWTDANNWDEAGAPVAGDDLIFSGGNNRTILEPVNDIGGNERPKSMTFSNFSDWRILGTSGTMTSNISGSTFITANSNIRRTGVINVPASTTFAIGAGVVLDLDNNVTVGGSQTLTVINLNPAGAVASITSGGLITLNVNNSALSLGDNVRIDKSVTTASGNNGTVGYDGPSGGSAEVRAVVTTDASTDAQHRFSATSGGTLLISRNVQGGAALRVIGLGTVIFSDLDGNTYGGAITEVDTGATLLVTNTSGSATGGSSDLRVDPGGTIGGTGFIGQTATILDDGMLSPGMSAGQLTFNNLVLSNLDGDGDLLWELGSDVLAGTDYDQTVVSDTLTLDADLNLDDFAFTTLSGFGPGTYTLFDAGTLSGAGTVDTTMGTLDGLDIQLSQVGQNVVLTVSAAQTIPEPSSLILVAFGLAGLIGCGRRRKR